MQALIVLAQRYPEGVMKTRDIAQEEHLPEKFLEAILRDLTKARFVESVRGASGGYKLRRPPEKLLMGEVLRLTDGPVAPFEDAVSLRHRIQTDPKHRPLFRMLLEIRDATARILDSTSLADLSHPQKVTKARQ